MNHPIKQNYSPNREYEQKLKAFMEDNGIDAEYLVFEESCHSVEDAARALGTTADCIVKNICLIGDGKFIVAVLKGEDKVDRSRIKDILKLSKVRIASPEEILERSGYPCGGVPSFGFEAQFLIDSRVMEKEKLYSGGGSTTSLIAITPAAIQRANLGIVADIRK